MLGETIFNNPPESPFYKGGKGMNHMVHAKGGFPVISQILRVSANRHDLDMLMAIEFPISSIRMDSLIC